jgi:hypothetical protein
MICDEMKIQENMNDYVEEQGGTYLCNAFDSSGCSSIELALIEELSKNTFDDQKAQLQAIGETTEEITSDVKKRKKLLKQFVANAEVREEL